MQDARIELDSCSLEDNIDNLAWNWPIYTPEY